MIIRDPNSGSGMKVNESGLANILAVSESIQHYESHTNERAYQVIGTVTPLAGTAPVMHLKNTSTVTDLVISYIRCILMDPAGGTAFPAAANYWTLAFNRTYGSGGTLVEPVNMNTGSGNKASATIYSGASAITLAGTALEFDREYLKAEAEVTRFNKEGALVIAPNDTMEVSLVSDHTSGIAYARVSFMEREHRII